MGCVYKISNGTFTYYGSTCNFKRRMRDHKFNCYHKKVEKYNLKLYKTIRDNGGWQQFTKEIIEDNIETKQQWKERETYYLRNFKCNMNTLHNITKEEYKKRQNARKKVYNEKPINKEKRKAHSAKQYQKNKAYLREKIKCECGRTICQGSKSKHIKNPTHIKLVVAKLMDEYISQII